ncbi:hypothetical protein E3N88_43268 [Mikania micrantha]|uniref:Uncharacterized protein n=1 Tax=Mikania micrantha TaxID=192012 RepID=A0A5N6LFF4_9ASTR|nr:hypothetical protein E3N88_43268 [Mikania micrantha]
MCNNSKLYQIPNEEDDDLGLDTSGGAPDFKGSFSGRRLLEKPDYMGNTSPDSVNMGRRGDSKVGFSGVRPSSTMFSSFKTDPISKPSPLGSSSSGINANRDSVVASALNEAPSDLSAVTQGGLSVSQQGQLQFLLQ